MKHGFQIKIILILLLLMCFFSTTTAQIRGAKQKIVVLKKINPQSKERLLKRLELYVDYLQNRQSEDLFKLIINNSESKMALGFNLITFEIDSQPEDFQKKFFKFQKDAAVRLGKILECKITDIVWKSSIHNSSDSEDDDALFVSINFKNGESAFWNKGYWFYAYFYNNEWWFTPLTWIDI